MNGFFLVNLFIIFNISCFFLYMFDVFRIEVVVIVFGVTFFSGLLLNGLTDSRMNIENAKVELEGKK